VTGGTPVIPVQALLQGALFRQNQLKMFGFGFAVHLISMRRIGGYSFKISISSNERQNTSQAFGEKCVG